MGNLKDRTAMRLLFVLCLGHTLDIVRSDVAEKSEAISQEIRNRVNDYSTKENDEQMIHLIQQQMLSLNKSGDASRDKRALGILLQGFMEALGYTVAPIQIASLANPTQAAQMPGLSLQPGPIPMPLPAIPANGTSATPRQRETLRFTGVLNFGNNANTSNLINHLARYEQLFHSDGSVGLAAPPPAPTQTTDPRGRPPLPEPLFVKIPLPIAPNLPPPQPPSPMPIKNDYQEEYSREQLEEYEGGRNGDGQHGDYEEENDKSHHSEEYENKHEEYNEPGDRNDEYGNYEKPEEKNIEKEYKNNKNVVNFSVEDKDIYDPREVSEEVPITDTKFNHAMYVNEPDWKKNHEEHLYKLAAEQEAHAEAVAEENAEREKDRNREHELTQQDKEFHDDREKEINDHNKDREVKYEARLKNKPYYKEDDEDEEDDSGSSEKESYVDNRRENDDDEDDDQEESKVSEVPPKVSRHTTPPSDISNEDDAIIADKTTTQGYNKYADQSKGPSFKYKKNYEDDEKQDRRQKNKSSKYYSTLPTYYREKPRRDNTLRDSYGESLEKPDGKVDERLSSYFTMFKNPETGIYDPNRIREYENARLPYDQLDLVSGFKRIQNEYGLPENKYEEYEIDDEGEGQVEHREKNSSRRPSSKDTDSERSEDEPRKNFKKIQPQITECNCNTRKSDGQSEEARDHDKSVITESIPSRISENPTNYESYHPTVKYLQEPLDYDQTIIARLTSYDPPTTARFEDTSKYTNPPGGQTSAYRYQTSTRPTETTILDRLPTKSLLPEVETKEIRAWPASFDYAYDNTEHKKVILKGPKSAVKDAVHHRPTTHQTPYDTTKSNCHHEAHSLPPGQFANKVQKLLRDHENERYDFESRNKHQRGPISSPSHSRLQKTKPQTTRIGYHSTHPSASTTASFEKGKKRQLGPERYVNYHEKSRTLTYPPLVFETRTPQPERTYTTKSPSQDRKIVRFSEGARNLKNRQATRAKHTAKEKYNNYLPLNTENSREESTNYVEKDGMLIIPEPTPYYYNERIDEFTNEPKSDTEKVKIKEYRNRIASVKVSNLKQVHPTGSTHIVMYSRSL